MGPYKLSRVHEKLSTVEIEFEKGEVVKDSYTMSISEISFLVNNGFADLVFSLFLQLVAESQKNKHLQASLLAEKEALASRVQQANAAAETHKQRVNRLDDQVYHFS